MKLKKRKNKKQNNTQIQIGFIERFNPAFLSVKQLNIKPKKIKAIRRTILSSRNKNNLHHKRFNDT